MKKLIELREQFEILLNPKIEYNSSVTNYLFDDNWVNETRQNYFDIKQDEFQNYVDKNFNYDDKNHIKFLKIRFQQLLDKCEQLNENKHEELSYFDNKKWLKSINYPNNPSQTEPFQLESPNPANDFDDRNVYILEIIKGFYNLDNEVDKYFEELEKEEEEEEEGYYPRHFSQAILNYFLEEKLGLDKYEIKQSYAKAHLSYLISLYNQMIRNIGKFIEKRIKIIEEIESFDEDILDSNSDVLESPNEIKLELAMKKQDIAIFFHTLHELKIIKTDTNNIYDSQTKLKSFINNSAFYYNFKNRLTKVGDIKKQFTELNQGYIKNKEVEFLKILISKFNSRIDLLESDEEKGLK